MKKQTALTFISQALTDKIAKTSVKVFINTCRAASTDDIVALFETIRSGKDKLTNAYKDKLGFWHFATI